MALFLSLILLVFIAAQKKASQYLPSICKTISITINFLHDAITFIKKQSPFFPCCFSLIISCHCFLEVVVEHQINHRNPEKLI